jgi:cobalt/nickel transport system permease protein
MAVCGAFAAVFSYYLLQKLRAPQWLAVFGASFISNMAIYSCTSAQLAIAFAGSTAAFGSNLVKFLAIFAVTQLPLAVIEGIFTVFAFRYIQKTNQEDLQIINPKLYETKNNHLVA